MKISEHFLQFLWHKKLFTHFNFHSTDNLPIEIIDFGQWNYNQGPDFLFAKIKYQNTIFVGHIELHVKSSDWLCHKHSHQKEYQNIILHVVYEDDVDIPLLKDKNIPTLVLQPYIDNCRIDAYQKLQQENFGFIPCEEAINEIEMPLFFHEENILRKLSDKNRQIKEQLYNTKNDYEAVLFYNLAYTFGLRINAETFRQIAESIDFSVIRKIRQNTMDLEALFFGLSGMLEDINDEMTSIWQRQFLFLKTKYKLPDMILKTKYSKLRPPNFPNIRWSQLAQLIYREPHLLSKIKSAQTIQELKILFKEITATDYWTTHYNFGKTSKISSPKKLSDEFIDKILINAILPIKYAFGLDTNENINDDIIRYYKDLKPEKNQILAQWKVCNVEVKSGLESQSLIYHYKNYCVEKKCLNCAIGFKILRK